MPALTATRTGLLTTTSRGIDAALFKPVYLGRDAHGVDPWNASDTIVAGPEGVVFTRHRDQLAMQEPDGRFAVYGYTVPFTSWSDSYGEARDRSNERSLPRLLRDRVRHVQGPRGQSHLLMIKAEGLLHADAVALRYLTDLARDVDNDHLHDEDDYMQLVDETFGKQAWPDYGDGVLQEILWANQTAGIEDPGLVLDRREDEWLQREFYHHTCLIDRVVGCGEHPPYLMPSATSIEVPHWGEAAWEVAEASRTVPAFESLADQAARHEQDARRDDWWD